MGDIVSPAEKTILFVLAVIALAVLFSGRNNKR
jgi:hypothetical protein